METAITPAPEFDPALSFGDDEPGYVTNGYELEQAARKVTREEWLSLAPEEAKKFVTECEDVQRQNLEDGATLEEVWEDEWWVGANYFIAASSMRECPVNPSGEAYLFDASGKAIGRWEF